MTPNERGVSMHCFRGFGPELLALLADNGLNLIELSTGQFPDLVDDERFARLERMLDDHHIRVNSIHVPFMNTDGWGYMDVSHLDAGVRAKTIEAALLCARRLLRLGGRYVILHPSTDVVPDAEREQRWHLAQEAIQALDARLPAGGGYRVAIECLPRTNFCHDAPETAEFMKPFGPRFGLCLDVNHTNFREDPVAALAVYGPMTITTHISDNDGVNEKHWMPGDGVIPWDAWYPALLTTGYAGPIIFETGQPEGQTHAQAIARIRETMNRYFPARVSNP